VPSAPPYGNAQSGMPEGTAKRKEKRPASRGRTAEKEGPGFWEKNQRAGGRVRKGKDSSASRKDGGARGEPAVLARQEKRDRGKIKPHPEKPPPLRRPGKSWNPGASTKKKKRTEGSARKGKNRTRVRRESSLAEKKGTRVPGRSKRKKETEKGGGGKGRTASGQRSHVPPEKKKKCPARKEGGGGPTTARRKKVHPTRGSETTTCWRPQKEKGAGPLTQRRE